MLLDMRAEEFCDVAQRDYELVRCSRSRHDRREDRRPNVVSVVQSCAAVSKNGFDDAWGISAGAAPEGHEDGAQHPGISGRIIELRAPFLDLTDQHIRMAGLDPKGVVDEEMIFIRRGAAAGDDTTSVRKPKREDIEIRRRPIGTVTIRGDDRILRHGEVSVDAEVCLNERDGGVHQAGPAATRGIRSVRNGW